jgi:hypothetical protein
MPSAEKSSAEFASSNRPQLSSRGRTLPEVAVDVSGMSHEGENHSSPAKYSTRGGIMPSPRTIRIDTARRIAGQSRLSSSSSPRLSNWIYEPTLPPKEKQGRPWDEAPDMMRQEPQEFMNRASRKVGAHVYMQTIRPETEQVSKCAWHYTTTI